MKVVAAVRTFTTLLALVGWAGLSAQESRTVVDRFERTYRSSKTLQATFYQRYFENGREIRSETGVAFFGRPGKMRWEYHAPEHNVYVIDGKWSWFYVPADHTVTRIRAKESSDWRTPLALLAGEMKVSRICQHVSVDSSEPPATPSHIVLRCELRGRDYSGRNRAVRGAGDSEDQSVHFEVNPASGELARISISDPGGVRVEFQFSSWKFDPRLDAKIFRFDPPKGVAIVDGDLPAEGSEAGASGASGSQPTTRP